MQEAARACPTSAPCPDHDARTRVCAGGVNRTRNATNQRYRDDAELTVVTHAAVQRGPPGLLPAARARSLRSQPGCYATGTSWPQEGPTPHDSMTSGADLVEEIVNCKRSRNRSPPIKPQCGPSATNGTPCRSPSVDGKVRQLPQATRPSTCCSGNRRCRIDRCPCGKITSGYPQFHADIPRRRSG